MPPVCLESTNNIVYTATTSILYLPGGLLPISFSFLFLLLAFPISHRWTIIQGFVPFIRFITTFYKLALRKWKIAGFLYSILEYIYFQFGGREQQRRLSADLPTFDSKRKKKEREKKEKGRRRLKRCAWNGSKNSSMKAPVSAKSNFPGVTRTRAAGYYFRDRGRGETSTETLFPIQPGSHRNEHARRDERLPPPSLLFLV